MKLTADEAAATPKNGREAAAAASDQGERMVLAAFQRELYEALAEMRKFESMEPAAVMLSISSWHARALEIRNRIMETSSRRADAFRTRQLDPFMEACEFQFKIYSRLHTTRQFEWDLAKGQG